MNQHNDHLQFLRKAKDDEELLKSILTLSHISDSIFGFHAQQAIDKLLKSVLSEKQIIFPKTHDLSVLIDLLSQNKVTLPIAEDELEWLTPFAVTFRYDDFLEEKLDRQKVLKLVTSLRILVEQRFPKA